MLEAECGGIFYLKEKEKMLDTRTTSAASVCECDEVYKQTPSLLPPSHRLILRRWPHFRMQWTQWWLTSSFYLSPVYTKSRENQLFTTISKFRRIFPSFSASRRFLPIFSFNPDGLCHFPVKFSRLLVPVSRLPTPDF